MYTAQGTTAKAWCLRSEKETRMTNEKEAERARKRIEKTSRH